MLKPTERPVIFSAQEVNAVLAGNKTQHRVPALTNEQVINGYRCCYGVASGQVIFTKDESDESFVDDGYISVECPFGKVGDRLWVKEDWRVGAWRETGGVLAIDYKASPEITNTPWVQVSDDEDGKKFEAVWIAVTDELDSKGVKTNDDGHYHWLAGQAPLDWRPASTMERWASRLLLEITDIRIERVQDTSHADAVSEGVHHFDIEARLRDQPLSVAQIVFSRHWDTKHQEHHVMWEDNPWVWVIEFKVIKESYDD